VESDSAPLHNTSFIWSFFPEQRPRRRSPRAGERCWPHVMELASGISLYKGAKPPTTGLLPVRSINRQNITANSYDSFNGPVEFFSPNPATKVRGSEPHLSNDVRFSR